MKTLITLTPKGKRVVCDVTFPSSEPLPLSGPLARNLIEDLGGDPAKLAQQALSTGEPVVLKYDGPPILLQKWLAAHEHRSAFLKHEPNGKALAKLTTSQTFASQELSHHGETPHSLRHWVRGGSIALVRDKSPVGADDGLAQQWEEMSLALEAVVVEGVAKPGIMTPFEMYEGCKINHTDLHCVQVPPGYDDFCVQLLSELTFPQRIEQTPGYDAVAGEVALYLKAMKVDVGSIMWVRHVPSGNRSVERYELEGCLLAARAVARDLGRPGVLVLGDPGGLDKDGKPLKTPKGCLSLLGLHMKDGDGKSRTQLQQLQFVRAIVQLSGALVVLGERTGSVDKFALCGGISCCQFVAKGVRQGNDRLAGVYVSGCGMSNSVTLIDCTNSKGVCALLTEMALRAIDERLKLEAALPLALDERRILGPPLITPHLDLSGDVVPCITVVDVPVEWVDGMQVIPVADDGHCLFHAIAALLPDDVTFAALRNDVAQFMEEDPRAATLIPDHHDADSYAAAIRNIDKDVLWGGDPEIQALSVLLNRPIHVHRDGDETLQFAGIAGGEPLADPGPALHIHHTESKKGGKGGGGRNHYDALT